MPPHHCLPQPPPTTASHHRPPTTCTCPPPAPLHHLSSPTSCIHQGFTCAAFQALPLHQRSVEDASILKLSAANHWKMCPLCGMMVERTHGCNHMLCRCNTNFCYQCGKQYISESAVANNNVGKPACQCPLFEVLEERETAQVMPQAVGRCCLCRGRSYSRSTC